MYKQIAHNVYTQVTEVLQNWQKHHYNKKYLNQVCLGSLFNSCLAEEVGKVRIEARKGVLRSLELLHNCEVEGKYLKVYRGTYVRLKNPGYTPSYLAARYKFDVLELVEAFNSYQFEPVVINLQQIQQVSANTGLVDLSSLQNFSFK